MQANWDEKYLNQVEHFSYVNTERKVCYTGEMSHPHWCLASYKQFQKGHWNLTFLLWLSYAKRILNLVLYKNLKILYLFSTKILFRKNHSPCCRQWKEQSLWKYTTEHCEKKKEGKVLTFCFFCCCCDVCF